LVKLLGSSEEKHQPNICPQSRRLAADIDFKMTQISDCVVISAEVSPAGVMNLAHYCFGIAITLFSKGALCRGYMTRGNIFHDDHQFIGTGYVHAVENEKSVAFMRADVEEEGTPFIQIDETVTDYVRSESDECVRKMFARIVRSDETYTAIYPFEAMSKVPSSLITWDFGARQVGRAVQRRDCPSRANARRRDGSPIRSNGRSDRYLPKGQSATTGFSDNGTRRITTPSPPRSGNKSVNQRRV
jgi:hypothetical protein